MKNRVFRAAINLALTGRKDESRQLFRKILEEDPDNETAFFWYLDLVPTDIERLQILHSYLKQHPDSEKAQKMLVSIDARSLADGAAEESLELNLNLAVPPITNEAAKESSGVDLSPTQPIHIRPNPKPPESYSSKAHRQVEVSLQGKGIKKRSPLSMYLIATTIVMILMACGGYWLYQLFTTNPLFLTEKQRYAREMDPVLVRINDWQNGALTEWETAMAEPVYEGQATKYRDLFQLSKTMGSPNILLTRKLSPIAGKISLLGYQIATQMNTVSSPQDIKEAHQQVLSCVVYTTEWATQIIDFLEDSLPVPDQKNPCSWYQTAFQQVTDYVNANK